MRPRLGGSSYTALWIPQFLYSATDGRHDLGHITLPLCRTALFKGENSRGLPPRGARRINPKTKRPSG